MATNRIRVAKDKAELVRALVEYKDTTGPFQTYADVLVFAAALGTKRKKPVPLGKISTKEPGPIGLDIFISRGYDWVFKLLAIAEIKETKILSTYEGDNEEKHILIFEEYANGGLEILKNELRGAVDYSDRLLLILSSERFKEKKIEEDFDLSRFL